MKTKKQKIRGWDDWTNIPKSPTSKLLVEVIIKYPALKKILHFAPKERIKFINQYYLSNYKKLLTSNLFDNCELIGTKKRPRGIQANIDKSSLIKLEKVSYIESISIINIEGAKEKKTTPKIQVKFFCVKLTVAIEIETLDKGLQTYEERFVLIKALSSEDAYKKIEKKKKEYESPYLNPYGFLVRWRIESLDDCYETYIDNENDFNNPDGIEVFSILKRRKLTKERIWDGKLK